MVCANLKKYLRPWENNNFKQSFGQKIGIFIAQIFQSEILTLQK